MKPHNSKPADSLSEEDETKEEAISEEELADSVFEFLSQLPQDFLDTAKEGAELKEQLEHAKTEEEAAELVRKLMLNEQEMHYIARDVIGEPDTKKMS